MTELDDLKKEINKKYNADIMVKGSKIKPTMRWSSGSVALDFELGGGLPVGKIITIVGEWSDGKTSLVLLWVAEFQKKYPHKEVLFVDAEGSFDFAWARTIGVDTDALWVVQPEYQQQAFDIINKAIEAGIGLVVVDSVAALVPKEEAEASFEDWNIGLAARINSKAMRGFQSTMNSKAQDEDIPPTLVLINQMRDVIGGGPYKQEKMPGGRAISFHSSVVIKLRKGDYFPKPKTNFSDAGDETPHAQQIKFYIDKNKTATPKRSSYLWWFFADHDETRRKGSIDRLEEIFRYALVYKVVSRRGKYYDLDLPSMKEPMTFMGSAAAASYIRDNPEIWDELYSELMRRIERSFENAPEEQELEASNESAPDESAGEASSEETTGKAGSGKRSDSVGETGRENRPVASAAQADW